MFIQRKKRSHYPKLNPNNKIARKFDFYAPLGDSTYRDIVGGLRPDTIDVTGLVNGKFGRSVRFDDAGAGADQYIHYGDVHDIGADDLSFGGWFRVRNSDVEYGLFGKSFQSGTDGRWSIYSDAGNMVCLVDTGAGQVVSVTDVWNDGKWHFFCVTIERGGSIRLYMNGVEVGSTSGVGTNNYNVNSYLMVGHYQDASGQAPSTSFDGLDGDMSDIFICHSLLTATEVRSLYENFEQIWEPMPKYVPVNVAAVGGATGKSNPLMGPFGGPLYGAIS